MRSLLILGLIGLQTALFAQDFRFTHYPFDSDLSERRGNTLHFGHDDMLYIGTSEGILSFDGRRFRRMFDTDTTAISVTTINSDTAGLWIGTEDGRVFYGGGELKQRSRGAGVPVRAIIPRDPEPLLATYGKGLLALRDTGVSRVYHSVPSSDLYAMIATDLHDIWVASDAGISHIPAGRDATLIHLNARSGILDEINISLAHSADGVIWAGSFEKGFCAIDSVHGIYYPFPGWSYGPVLCMVPVSDTELWISTEQHGLFQYVRTRHVLNHVALPGNPTPVIVDMRTDPEGNLWLLDAYRGLYRTNRRFEEYTTSVSGIQALMFDHSGSLYAGNADGLYMLRLEDAMSREKILMGVNVVSLYEDRHHNLWVGTFGQGLWCRPVDGKRWLTYRKENGLTDESILSITGMADTLWLATLGGVTRILVSRSPDQYRLHTTNYNLADGLGTNFIYTAFADSKGHVWFGTDGNGLSVLGGDEIMNFQQADSTTLHSVYSIAEDASGRIWFVTDRDGVFRINPDAFVRIRLPAPYQDHEISNIIADPLGNMLLAHTTGIDLITPDGNTILYRDGATELLNPNLNAHFRDSTGGIWIAGQQAILKYNPLKSAHRNFPRNLLTDVSIFLTPVDFRQKCTFNAGQNYLTFGFTGLWYTDPDAVVYRYMLEGLDPGWKQTRETAVTYQNIPPGDYRFVLESSSSGMFPADNAVSYAFTIRKPFYQTAGFIIIAGFLCVLSIYTFLRVRDDRINRAAALERRQIESQLQTLKAQINPHFLFNSFNTLVSVIEEDPRAAVAYVENLSDFYRSILQYREKNLIPLREEIEIVRTYMHILEKRFGEALRLEIPAVVPDVWIVPLVLQILVENAVKHNVISERKPLTISIKEHERGSLIVENTLQKKPAAGDSTGFGLQNIVSRYALLTKRPVQVGQNVDVFYVIVPVLEKHEIPDY